uniref:M67 family metallopeptidase n=1 Tax=Desertifilum tharense IPPAS B-1220 TaxID=1781255 RepID=A0ACD5GMI3_9CYAN
MQTRVAILELRQANNRTPAACNNKYILGATPIVNLQISQQYLQQICQQVERHYPQESCGLLLGRVVAQVNCIVEIYPTENSWDEADLTAFAAVSGSASLGGSRRERYAIAPQTLLQVQRQARDRDLQIVGVYHSHPDHPASPSEFDRAIACTAILLSDLIRPARSGSRPSELAAGRTASISRRKDSLHKRSRNRQIALKLESPQPITANRRKPRECVKFV